MSFPVDRADSNVATRMPAPASDQASTHRVCNQESLLDIAQRYHLTPQAIREANPQIFRHIDRDRREEAALDRGDVLFAGDVLTIPAASQSVLNEPASADVNPSFPSTNSEYKLELGEDHRVGIAWNPGDGTVKISHTEQTGAGVDYTPRNEFGLPSTTQPGAKFGFQAGLEKSVAYGGVNKGGNTEFTVEADVKLTTTVSGASKAKTVAGPREYSLEAGVVNGFRAKYKVVLPGENRTGDKAREVNPFNPVSIPPGATVTLDKQSYTGTVMEASFRNVALQSRLTEASGTVYSVTRSADGNSVKVFTGPTAVVEAHNLVGVDLGDLSVLVGRQDLLGGSSMQTAQFDLNNPDSQAAFSYFMANGHIPHETQGVSNAAAVDVVNYSSQSRAVAELGPLSADLAGAESAGTFTRTTYADGSYSLSSKIEQKDMQERVPFLMVQRFDAHGNELLFDRTYSFEVRTDKQQGTAEYLSTALYGRDVANQIPRGSTINLTFTQTQMHELMTQAATAQDAYQIPSQGDDLRGLLGDGGAVPYADAGTFAIRMATNLRSDPYRFAERLVTISRGADGDLNAGLLVPIAANVTVKS